MPIDVGHSGSNALPKCCFNTHSLMRRGSCTVISRCRKRFIWMIMYKGLVRATHVLRWLWRGHWMSGLLITALDPRGVWRGGAWYMWLVDTRNVLCHEPLGLIDHVILASGHHRSRRTPRLRSLGMTSTCSPTSYGSHVRAQSPGIAP